MIVNYDIYMASTVPFSFLSIEEEEKNEYNRRQAPLPRHSLVSHYLQWKSSSIYIINMVDKLCQIWVSVHKGTAISR